MNFKTGSKKRKKVAFENLRNKIFILMAVSVSVPKCEALEMLLGYLNVFKPCFTPDQSGDIIPHSGRQQVRGWQHQFFFSFSYAKRRKRIKIIMRVKWSMVPSVIPLSQTVLTGTVLVCRNSVSNYETVWSDGRTSDVLCCVFDNYFLLFFIRCFAWVDCFCMGCVIHIEQGHSRQCPSLRCV